MRPHSILRTCLFIFLVLSVSAAAGMSSGQAEPPPGFARMFEPAVQLRSSSNAGLSFEVRVSPQDLAIQEVVAAGQPYLQVTYPGFDQSSQAGAPALPFISEHIGVPHGVQVDVQVTPGEGFSQVLPTQILPAETPHIHQEDLSPAPADADSLPQAAYRLEEDPAVYRAAQSFPGVFAQAANDGRIRGQRVVGINLYPFQYHPGTQELVVYETLLVEVRFSGTPAPPNQAVYAESPVYEAFFDNTLLNYDSARQWRQPGGQDATPDQAEGLPWLPPNPGWRITIEADGVYQVDYAQLADANLPVDNLDPRTFRLYHLGSEVAIHVAGQENGQFDPGDALLFYGQGTDTKYNPGSVYWLTYGGDNGNRIQGRDAAPSSAPTPAYYPAHLHREENNYYRPLAPGEDDLDRWFWDYLLPPNRPTWTHTLNLTEPYQADGQAILTLAMVGYRNASQNPDHHVEVHLNTSAGRTRLGETWWDGIAWEVLALTFDAALLQPGENTIEVTAHLVPGTSIDFIFIDWINLAFPNTFIAEQDQLPFTYTQEGTWQFEVDGFTTNQVTVYDITDPLTVQTLENGHVLETARGYAVQFEDSVTDPARYQAFTPAALKPVTAIEPAGYADLQSLANGADHIIITHADFLAEAETLRAHRSAEMRAVTVNIQDIYDQFNYGMASASAIRDFLAYTYHHWQAPAPTFVVLMGDGHYDPKNYVNERTNFIPPFLAPVDPWIGETAADNRYVTLTGADTLPDMMIGRLSVNTPAQAQAIVDKIIAYEHSNFENWHQHILAVADNADSGGNYPAISDSILNDLVPDAYTVEKVYHTVTHLTPSETRAAIQAGFNQGKFLVTYFGHGYHTGWAQEDLLKTEDIPLLTNGPRYPIVLAMTCYEGYFHRPHSMSSRSEAMAEVITNTAGKGAVASWSPTGLGLSSGHNRLTRGFFDAVFHQHSQRLGQATLAGKLNLWSAGSNLDLLDTYTLFGDPALQLQTGSPIQVFLPLFFQ